MFPKTFLHLQYQFLFFYIGSLQDVCEQNTSIQTSIQGTRSNVKLCSKITSFKLTRTEGSSEFVLFL